MIRSIARTRALLAFFQSLERVQKKFPTLGILFLIISLPGAPSARAGWVDPAIASNLQAMADARVLYGGIGAGIWVEDRAMGTGTVVAGLGRIAPIAMEVQPSDRFRIASCSKTFTAASIFLLKEQGLLNFDVAISNYLSQYTIPSNNTITIRHLLTHTSGLPDHDNESSYFDDRLHEDPLTYFAPTQVLAVVSTMTNNFAPGEKYRYCDTGYYLLHLIIAQVNTNGWTYQQFVENKLIGPLGLTNTFVPGTNNNYLSNIPGDHVRGYDLDESNQWTDVTVMNQSFDIGCGGMVSSLDDLCKWGRALYTGQVISTNSLAEMLAVTPQSMAAESFYGMGAVVSASLGYGHAGGTFGYSTRFTWDPLRQTAYAAFINCINPAGSAAGELVQQAKRVLGYPDIENPRYSNTIAATTALLTNLIAQYQVPAISIALVDGTNVVWAQGFGMANRERTVHAGYETIYRLASLSKAFAGLSAMRLQEDGLVDINADITNSIRNFSLLPRFTNQVITIRDCLAHQAGIPETYFKYAESTTQRTDYYASVQALMSQDYLNFPPGFIEMYNNNGPTLMESVVPGVYSNGVGYRTFATTRLFTPMGMSDTAFTLVGQQTNRLAKIYREDGLRPDEYVNAFASGGIYSSVNDMSRWLRFLLGYGTFNGATVLSSNSIATVWADQVTHTRLRKDDAYMQCGLGWDQINDPYFAYAGRACWKNGSASGYGSMAIVMPERKLGVVVLNSIEGPDRVVEPAARQALRQAILERDGLMWPTNTVAFPSSTPVTLSTQALAGMVGHYSAAGGYDLVTGTVDSITWIRGADSATPVYKEGFIPHADGWFRSTNETSYELSFTNVEDRVFMKYRMIYSDSFIMTGIVSERFTPAPLDAAWSNRADQTWICADLEPGSYFWVLGFFPTLSLTMDDGVLSVRSSFGSVTLQPTNDYLAFPFLVSAENSWSLQVVQTNGHEIVRYGGFNFRALDDLPSLQAGQSATGTLAAEGTELYQFTITDPVWHNFYVLPTNLIVRLDPSEDLSTPGHYAMILQNPTTSAVAYTVRLYNFTNTIARMTSWMGEQMTNYGVVGAVITLVNDQDVVWMQGFGEADREQHIPVTPDTVFRIASVSKTFGACAVMQLVEQGQVDLDEPLTNYVPHFSIRQRHGATNVITVRTVLDQHAGLPCDIGNGYETFAPYTNYIDGLIEGLHNDYAPLPTNTMWHYSNAGFAMLTKIIEEMSGQPLAQYSQSNLFLPMGMTNTSFFHDHPWYDDHLSLGYGEDGEPVGEEYHNAYTAGSIYSTVQDMSKYIRMILAQGQGAQGRVLESATVDEMLTSQTAGLPLDVIPMNNWGLGWGVRYPALDYAGRLCFHDGELTLSFCSFLGILRDQKLGVFVSFNTGSAGSLIHPAGSRCLQWAVEDKAGLTPPIPPQPVFSPVTNLPSAEMDAVTGIYVSASGYDFVRRCPTNAYQLDWVVGAQSEAAPVVPLVARVNGRFSTPGTQTVELVFTNLSGRDVCVKYQYNDLFGHLPSVYAARVAPTPISAAWSNRFGEHWVMNLNEQDVVRSLMPVPFGPVLRQQDGLLLFNLFGEVSVLQPENDNLAFIAGLGRNQGIAVRIDSTNGVENLWYQNYRFTYAPPRMTAQESSSQEVQLGIANLRAGVTNRIERTTNLLSDGSWDLRHQFISTTSGSETNWQEPLSATNATLYYRVLGL
jgi:CubicO group peptidase (beta-lactamase class C family)